MTTTTDIGQMLLAILPEIGLLILAGLVLVLDLGTRGRPGRNFLGWVTAAGLVVIGVLAAVFSQPGVQPVLMWGGMLRLDSAGFLFRMLFLTGAALTALFAMESESVRERGEFYVLLLVSTLGMSLMASATDLILLYLAIETTSIPLYVLAGFVTVDQKSVESGIKYLLFGAMTSAVMLFGFSFLYGFTGTTSIFNIAQAFTAGGIPLFAGIAALMMVLVGFGFKISAVPFHFWAPDVYEGSPTPVAGFLSTASKAAGFAVLLRVMFVAFPSMASIWSILIAILATASMFVGNLLALAQKNIKRLLAYSSIAQAGYILIGVAADTQFGATGAVYYLMAYLVTNLAAFGIVTVVGRAVGSDEISAYAGLSRRSPVLSLGLLAALLSLGGIPPFAGFFSKLLVFGAAIQQGMLWLAIVGIVNAIIGLYYYLTVLKVVYLYRSEEEARPLLSVPGWKVALIVCLVGVVTLGIVMAPWYTLSSAAATAFGVY
jgi:NADH-quinone oxidoreductase subunit N